MDELHGDVKDLNESLGRLSLLPPNWSGKSKIGDWLDTLSSMQVCPEQNSHHSNTFHPGQ